jgi:hypothetical protein
MVERGGADSYPHVVARHELWRGYIGAKSQLIELAMSVDRQRSHGLPRRLYSAKTRPSRWRPGVAARRDTLLPHAGAFRAAPPILVTGFAE